MKEVIKYTEEVFALCTSSDPKHQQMLDRVISALTAIDAVDTAFQMIAIHGHDQKLSPQAIKAINEALPLVRIARYGKDRIETNDLVEFAKQILKKAGYIQVYWHKDDIRGQVYNDKLISLTDAQVDRIAEAIAHHHDAEIGVNWENILYHTKEELKNDND
ncbi:MAG: hypothetical protein ACK52I_02765 [Pseudomonadota bacterium]|jgi:transcription antitermination factor NusA-like protein